MNASVLGLKFILYSDLVVGHVTSTSNFKLPTSGLEPRIYSEHLRVCRIQGRSLVSPQVRWILVS